MGTRPSNGLSLCAGGGGLDMGLQLAEPGYETRCYVEWEKYPQQCIIAAQRNGHFAPAPIWDDVTTFDGRPWRGRIDTIIAGYPCQPFSAAGQRKGEDDERHLWPGVDRIVGEIHPEWVFFENVDGHISLGLDTVIKDLGRLGYRVACGLFSTAETDGTQGRKRVFIVGRSESRGQRERGDAGVEGRGRHADGTSGAVAVSGHPLGRSEDTAGNIGNGADARWEEGDNRSGECTSSLASGESHNRRREQPARGPRGGRARSARDGAELADDDQHDPSTERQQRSGELRRHSPDGSNGRAPMDGSTSARCKPTGKRAGSNVSGGQCLPGEGCDEFGGTGRAGREGHEFFASCGNSHRAGAHGSTPEPSGIRLHHSPPRPNDLQSWRAVINMAPHLAPTTSLSYIKRIADNYAAMVAQGIVEESEAESVIRLMADALADRPRALRLLGNGVDPVTAGHAWRNLSLALGLWPLDLGAEGTDDI